MICCFKEARKKTPNEELPIKHQESSSATEEPRKATTNAQLFCACVFLSYFSCFLWLLLSVKRVSHLQSNWFLWFTFWKILPSAIGFYKHKLLSSLSTSDTNDSRLEETERRKITRESSWTSQLFLQVSSDTFVEMLLW